MIDRDELLTLAEQAQPYLTGPEQAHWLARLEQASPRIDALLRQCLDAGDDTGLRLCTLLGRAWWMIGQVQQGRDWMRRFLTRPVADADLHAKALEAAAGLDYACADYASAERHLLAALAHWRSRNAEAEARLLNQLGMLRRGQTRCEEANLLHEQALTICRSLGDLWGEAMSLNNLGVVAMFVGELDRARELHEQALLLRRRLDDDRGVASSLGNLGNVARLSGDLETAWRRHSEALTIRVYLKDRWGMAGSHVNLGAIAAMRGDLAEADRLLDEAEMGFAAVGDALGLCEVMDARALLAALLGMQEAAQLFAAAEGWREKLGMPLPPAFRAEVERVRGRMSVDPGG